MRKDDLQGVEVYQLGNGYMVWTTTGGDGGHGLVFPSFEQLVDWLSDRFTYRCPTEFDASEPACPVNPDEQRRAEIDESVRARLTSKEAESTAARTWITEKAMETRHLDPDDAVIYALQKWRGEKA